MTTIQIPEKTVLIASGYEGLDGLKDGRYYPYYCMADKSGTKTIGRGRVVTGHDSLTGKFQHGLSLAEVDALFMADLEPRAQHLHVALEGKYTPDQFAAALSGFYNYERMWTDGTPVYCHRMGKFRNAAQGILLYIVSDNKKRLGLYRRRMTEALCYLTGEVMIAKCDATEQALEKRLHELCSFIRPKFQ